MKKLLITLVIISASFLSLPFLTCAQEETTNDVTVAVEENPEEIEKLREEIQKQVQEKLDSIIDQEEKKGWAGEITKKGETGFEINFKDETKTITLGSEITIIGDGRDEITFQQLNIGDYVLIMGYLQIDGVLEARRIIVTEETKTISTKAIFGTINDKSAESNVLLVSDKDGKEYELIVKNTTTLRQKLGDEKEKIKYDDIEAGQKLVAIISPSESNGSTFNAVEIITLPSPEKETPEE